MAAVYALDMRMEATALRNNLFGVLKGLEHSGPVEIVRNGRVDAVLQQAPKQLPDFDQRRLGRICKRHGIQKLTAFGSYARGFDFGPESDVDLLVQLMPKVRKSFDRHMDIVFALEDLFGRSVDLHYAKSLATCDPNMRTIIEAESKVIYGA